jgi:hypothetical protein
MTDSPVARLPALASLSLATNRLGPPAAAALASALEGGGFRALERLVLHGNELGFAPVLPPRSLS